jgi:hypothetical protein
VTKVRTIIPPIFHISKISRVCKISENRQMLSQNDVCNKGHILLRSGYRKLEDSTTTVRAWSARQYHASNKNILQDLI